MVSIDSDIHYFLRNMIGANTYLIYSEHHKHT